MNIKELLDAIKWKHMNADGYYPANPATLRQISKFESKIGFNLPDDFRELYSITNGFGCLEDIFNIIPLENIMDYPQDYGPNWFYFAEYMIFSDMWALRKNDDGSFDIYNGSNNVVLTHSLAEFLERFLKGGVFEDQGLYSWPG